MSRVVMWNLPTLDGSLEGRLRDEFERSAIDLLRSAERLRFGRVTYGGMAEYWPGAKGEVAELMNSIAKFIFTRGASVTP